MCIFRTQKRKVLLIMDSYVAHSHKHVDRSESFGFSSLQLRNIAISF